MNNHALMSRFNRWANQHLYACAERLTDADYRADLGAFFRSIHRTFNHLLVADRLWMARMRGDDPGRVQLDEELFADFGALRAARDAQDRELIELVDGLPPETLAGMLRFRLIVGGGERAIPFEHGLLTLFNHQTHHRGQVHAMLTRLGQDVPPLDVVMFLGDPAAAG